MAKDGKYLDVIDDKGKVLYKESRKKIHQEGLLHREIHVWIVCKGEIVFQKRAEDKETFPGLLDASVGGHVESGDGWLESAVKEVSEETGLKIEENNLIFVKQTITMSNDKVTGLKNHALRRSYLLNYNGDVSDLRVEQGKGLGFVSFSDEELVNLDEQTKKQFIPQLLSKEYLDFYSELTELASSS